jgi:hypothetical protein
LIAAHSPNDDVNLDAPRGRRSQRQRVLVQQIIPGQTGLGDEIAWEIVGVIADEKIGGLDDVQSGGMYVSYRQSPAIALLLAAVGIYGVISYSVAQRTHEMGIRAALGASGATLRRLVFRGGMRLALIGLAVGLAGALAVTRVMTSILSGVSPRDPVTLAAVAVVLAVVAAVACFIPARRVTRVAPNSALRYQ